LHYPGIKEDVYVSRFRPDPALRQELGLEPGNIVVTLRPPATEAHYHNPESEALFRASIELLAAESRVKTIVLPRNGAQKDFICATWPDLVKSSRLMFLPRAVDGLNLIWHSDLVISGGGTMNREAAALGVPVYSIFRGPIGAVDRFLASQGRLVMVSSADEVRTKVVLIPRRRDPDQQVQATMACSSIVDHIIRAAGAGNAVPAATRAK